MTGLAAAACLSLLPLLALSSPLLGQHRAPKSFKLAVPSCPRADSLLGPANGEPQSLRAEAFPAQDTVRVYAGEMRKTLEASIRASRDGPIDDPDARLYMIVDGAAKRAMFASPDSLRFTLLIDDSLFDLGPPHIGVPRSPAAGIGFDVWIGPLMLSKLVRANRVEAHLGGATIQTGDNFQGSLRASYRVAVCGVPSGTER